MMSHGADITSTVNQEPQRSQQAQSSTNLLFKSDFYVG